jgi:hypothetical protein
MLIAEIHDLSQLDIIDEAVFITRKNRDWKGVSIDYMGLYSIYVSLSTTMVDESLLKMTRFSVPIKIGSG